MNNELSIDISVKVCVDAKTALKCLRIIEMYLEENKDKKIVSEICKDGSTRLLIVEVGKQNGSV